MDKDTMVAILKENNYPAENVDGVVYVYKALTREEVRDVIELMRKAQYNESSGFKVKR